MAIGLLGRKVGMTQIFDEAGTVIPVTVIQAGPCRILQLKTKERDAYEAVQLGFLEKPRRLASRSERGHVAKLESKRSKVRAAAKIEAAPKADCEPPRFVREFRSPVADCQIGQILDVSQFLKTGTDPKTKKDIDVDVYVDITGTSKGRGTAGVMVRHNFKGQRATHGVKKVHRHAGSIGCSQFPGHVTRGRRMAGQHGNARRTTRNLKVVRVDQENNLLLVRGGIPGPNGGLVLIRVTNVSR
jgi:large subunit ribosomal protein L3